MRLVANATEGRVPNVRVAASGARRANSSNSDGGRAADSAGPVERPAVRRHGAQEPHAEHHRQAADAAVVRAVGPGAVHRAPALGRPRAARRHEHAP